MRSTVARSAYCVSLDYRLFKFHSKYVILLQLLFNYDEFQRFHRHLKNARSNRQSGPFFGSPFEPFTFDGDVLPLQNLIIFDGYTRRLRTDTRTDTHHF